MKSKLLVSLAAAALTAAAFAAISVAQNGDSDDRPEGDVRAAPGAPMMFHHRIAPSSERERAAMEEFRKCMADNGADLPEPPDLGEMRRGEMPAHPEPPTEEEIEALRKAHEACEDKLPEGAEFGIAGCDDDDGEDESGEDEGPREENGAESGAESEGAAA